MDLRKIDFNPGSQARKIISNEFFQPIYQPFREWYFQNFSKEETVLIQNQFYGHLTMINEYKYFIPWFIDTYFQNYVNVIERKWTLRHNKEDVHSVYPHTTHLQIKKDNMTLYASAVLKLIENDHLMATVKNINELTEQNNFTNLYLVSLGDQMTYLTNRVHSALEKIQEIKDLGKIF